MKKTYLPTSNIFKFTWSTKLNPSMEYIGLFCWILEPTGNVSVRPLNCLRFWNTSKQKSFRWKNKKLFCLFVKLYFIVLIRWYDFEPVYFWFKLLKWMKWKTDPGSNLIIIIIKELLNCWNKNSEFDLINNINAFVKIEISALGIQLRLISHEKQN